MSDDEPLHSDKPCNVPQMIYSETISTDTTSQLESTRGRPTRTLRSDTVKFFTFRHVFLTSSQHNIIPDQCTVNQRCSCCQMEHFEQSHNAAGHNAIELHRCSWQKTTSRLNQMSSRGLNFSQQLSSAHTSGKYVHTDLLRCYQCRQWCLVSRHQSNIVHTITTLEK